MSSLNFFALWQYQNKERREHIFFKECNHSLTGFPLTPTTEPGPAHPHHQDYDRFIL